MFSPKIEIKKLSKVFFHRLIDTFKVSSPEKLIVSSKDKVVIDNLTLDIHSGEVIGIIGKNGAGKSTLLSILAGVASLTSGTINIIGKVTAVMTLGVGLREDLSGRENIYIDGEIQGKSRCEIDEFIEEIIEFSELIDFIDKPVKLYSTGMKSRLAFAMLVCIEPEILIIDEALSAGDVFFAEKAAKKIKEICRRGKIVIIVSHSMGAIQSMCNRCLWLDKGHVVMDGLPDDVTCAYLEKIKEEDDNVALQHYQDEVSEQIAGASLCLKSVQLKVAGSSYQKKIFYTGDPFGIEILFASANPRGIKKTITECFLKVYIERLDGLLVDYQQIDLCVIKSLELDSTLELSLASLVLNKGIYQLKMEVIENQSVVNRYIRFFEVRNNKMATGGYSLLQYPAEILLINKENCICSDSKELMVK